MTAHAGFATAADALSFIRGGKAFITLSSAKTGKHFTYRIVTGAPGAPREGKPFFVSVLNGPDNWANYGYIGFIPHGVPLLIAGNKGRGDAPSFKALAWALGHLVNGRIPADLTIRHEGKCSVCSKKLTNPISIDLGIGPICRALRHWPDMPGRAAA